MTRYAFLARRITSWVVLLALLSGCAATAPELAEPAEGDGDADFEYLIGPGDRVNVFVWRNPEVSLEMVPVRPDGRISTPLVEDMVAANKTPAELARDIEERLGTYIKDPLVTVTVMAFVGGFDEQIRVIGEALAPAALPFRSRMTVLDVVIAVGGLTEFAAGNRAVLVRQTGGQHQEIRLRLDDLIKDGDISANVAMAPGDILIIPESRF